jgi:hypothetical protein
VAGHYAEFMADATKISKNFKPFIPTAELWGILAPFYKMLLFLIVDFSI